MKETLAQDYIIMARSKGLQEKTILYKHALRNSITPLVSYIGIIFGTLIVGTVYVESVFLIQGVGYLLWQAVLIYELQTINSIIIFITLMFLIVNLLVDLAYGIIDPRVRQ